MAGFNPMSLSSGGTPGADTLGLSVNPSLGLEAFDQDLGGFDESLLDGVNGLPPLSFNSTYDFETFSTTFEDPFSYSTTRAYEAAPDPESFNEEASPQELDNKLLSFSAPVIKASVVDETGQFAELHITAELFGMFFVAEDVYTAENTGRPLELTCYRRNLWQCSGQMTLPRHLAHLVSEQGLKLPIVELAASITAVESIEGKPTEIISIPWKSSNPNSNPNSNSSNGGGGDEAKVAAAPPHVPVDLASGQELDNNRVSVPVSWKRLQFKHATANNGRRKGLQQHYVVQIALLAKLKSGDVVKVAEVQSGPVIVRGRSPRNFDSRKDVPLSAGGDKKPDRRSLSGDGAGPSPLKQERAGGGGDLAQNIPRYQPLGTLQQSASDWATPAQPYGQNPHPAKKMALSPNMTRPPVPAWSTDSSASAAKPHTPKGLHRGGGGGPTLPISLSLSEDERSPNRNSSESLASPQFAKSLPAQAGYGPAESSPLENGELLYEYFPLSLDDWMPPVDAIYRPHVVHHTVVPPEVKAQQMRSKTKRYFAAE